MWDGSTPVPVLPKWLKVVAGYIGGDTPHVWTYAEWKACGDRKRLPIWVNDKSTPQDGRVDGWAIVQRCYALRIAKGSPVVVDMETSVDPIYLLNAQAILHWAGYKVWVYGSNGTVQKNPACDGYFVATLDGVPSMVAGPSVRATQYVDRGRFDTSLVKWSNYVRDLKTW
jgi:hypothetical protein